MLTNEPKMDLKEMKTQPNKSPLMLLANTLGWPLAFVLRKQLGLVNWLETKGWSKGLAKLIVKVFDVLVLTILLFIIFPGWMGFVALFVLAAIVLGVDFDIELPKNEAEQWRDGIDGYGLYDNQFDMRIDGGHANDDNNPNKHY